MIKRKHTEAFKFKVALEALKGDHTVAVVAQTYEVNPSQVRRWKQQLMTHGKDVFSETRTSTEQSSKAQDKLYERIGKLSVEVDFLKKKSGWE